MTCHHNHNFVSEICHYRNTVQYFDVNRPIRHRRLGCLDTIALWQTQIIPVNANGRQFDLERAPKVWSWTIQKQSLGLVLLIETNEAEKKTLNYSVPPLLPNWIISNDHSYKRLKELTSWAPSILVHAALVSFKKVSWTTGVASSSQSVCM